MKTVAVRIPEASVESMIRLVSTLRMVERRYGEVEVEGWIAALSIALETLRSEVLSDGEA